MVQLASRPLGIQNMIKPNYSMAVAHLTILDESAEKFTFQLFRENVDGGGLILHGSLEKLWPKLVSENQRGKGVFVCVNETDFKGRTKENITRVRALWQEDDNKGAKPLPVEPHLAIESSPGKYHRYILTDTKNLDEFEPIQSRLVDDFWSDPNANDRPGS